MIYNLHVPTQSTWVLKPNVTVPASDFEFSVRFISKGVEYPRLTLSKDIQSTQIPIITYDGTMIGLGKSGTKTVNSWVDNDYRKITFLKPLPATLLDWLKSNAIRDGALKPTWLWKGYDVQLSTSKGSAVDWDNSVDETTTITIYSALTLDRRGNLIGAGTKEVGDPWTLYHETAYASYFWYPVSGWVQGFVQDYDIDFDADVFTGYPVSVAYSKGSTEKLWFASENRNAYPTNGRSGNTWYVRQ